MIIIRTRNAYKNLKCSFNQFSFQFYAALRAVRKLYELKRVTNLLLSKVCKRTGDRKEMKKAKLHDHENKTSKLKIKNYN